MLEPIPFAGYMEIDAMNKPVAWIIDEKMTDCDDNFIWNTGDYPDWQVKDWTPVYTHPVKELHLSLQKSQDGELLAVTYTDDEHKIVEVLWERPPVKEQGNAVAWRSQSPDGYWSLYGAPVEGSEPLYTGFKELTDDEIEEFAYAFQLWQLHNPDKALEGIMGFARAILRKAQEK